MSETLLDVWALYGTTYLAGVLLAALLGLVGLWILAREQIFLGAAIGQASTLGIALVLWLGGLGAAAHLPGAASRAAADVAAVAASVTTALWTAAPPRPDAAPGEGRTAWIFLAAASLPVLLLAHSPHGLEEVTRLMSSTLLGIHERDLLAFGVLAGASALAVARWSDRLRLLALDPAMAAAVGLRVPLWLRGVALWLGLAVGLAIRASGLVYTFGCLVLPALVARNLCRELRPMLWVAPAVAAGAAAAAFALAHLADVPPAHAAVALLCALVLATAPLRPRA